MRITSWNVNGIRAVLKKGAFEEYLISDTPDIFCVQETKAHKRQLPDELTDVPGYHAYFAEAERKGYSGVAVYTKEKPTEVRGVFAAPILNGEGRILEAHFKKFILFNVYFPNGNASDERLRYKLDFYDAFLALVNEYTEAGKSVVFCGDVNTAHREIDLARPKENRDTSGFLPIECAWMDRCVEEGYYDTLRLITDQPELYSWWDFKTRARERNVGWRIDYVFVNKKLKAKVREAFILSDVMGSDHCPVGVELAL